MNEHGSDGLRTALSRLPREARPSRDLWPGIAVRISGERPARDAWERWWPRGAGIAAAAALVAVAVVLTPGNDTREPPVVVAGGQASGIVIAHDPGLQLASETILDALAGGNGGTMSPETLAVVRENLMIMEQASREIARALEQDPDNPRLQRQLLDTHRSQALFIDYLMRVSTEPTTRIEI